MKRQSAGSGLRAALFAFLMFLILIFCVLVLRSFLLTDTPEAGLPQGAGLTLSDTDGSRVSISKNMQVLSVSEDMQDLPVSENRQVLPASEKMQKSSASEKLQGISMRKCTLSVKGLDRTYRIIVMSDLHIIIPDDPEVDEDRREEVRHRIAMFRTKDGEASLELWKCLPEELDAMRTDMILFAGDMVDFATKSSTAVLKQGFDSLKTPWMYVRGDHDYAAWYSQGFETQKDAIRLQADAAPRSRVMVQKIGNLTVIGWDNNTSQMTGKGLADLKAGLDEARKSGSPVLFLCHVPLLGDTGDADESEENTVISDTEGHADGAEQEVTDANRKLAEKSREDWGGRVLLWGKEKDCFYQPDETTAETLNRILAEDSPVQLVVSGHVHFPYEGALTGTVTQVIAAPAFEGAITELELNENVQ